MRRTSWLMVLGSVLAAGGLWIWNGNPGGGSGVPLGASPAPPALTDLEVRDLDIRFYRERVSRDPEAAADLARLAALYLQRARETGEREDFRRAEAAARRSLATRRARNAPAYLQLASSLLAQHFFLEALEAAQELVLLEPERPHHRALLGEIQLEFGRYEEAALTFGRLGGERRNLAVAPRLARWAEITGRTEDARALLESALEEAKGRSDLAREQVAWFHLRVGDLELRNGRLDAAEKALGAGLAEAPEDARLLAAMARLRAARGDWRGTLAYGRRAARIIPDIATVGLIGDAYAALDQHASAESAYRDVERMAREAPEPYNRAWTLFRVDHARELPETIVILRRELETRRDVFGHDQLAWALYGTGDYTAAREAMAGALRMGTEDAVLFFHAGMIERALGSRTAARHHLKRALAINPYFHPVWAAVARDTLASLEAHP